MKQIPIADSDLIEDDVVAIERELEAKSPNRPRVKRLLIGLGERADKVGLAAITALLTNLLAKWFGV